MEIFGIINMLFFLRKRSIKEIEFFLVTRFFIFLLLRKKNELLFGRE